MTIFQSLQPYFWPKFDVMIFHHFSKAIALIFDQIWLKDFDHFSKPTTFDQFDVMIFHHFSKAIALIFDQIWPKDLWPFFQAYNLSFDQNLV